jgi:uncharacterized RmlC-like cupin family protein
MQVVKPGADRETARGVVGGSEISQATTGARDIYMGRFRVPPGARSRPHYHQGCESALYMLSGRIAIHFGEHLEQRLVVEEGDQLYVPPRETHIVENLSEEHPADYVVARDAPQEDSVEVPWADTTPKE